MSCLNYWLHCPTISGGTAPFHPYPLAFSKHSQNRTKWMWSTDRRLCPYPYTYLMLSINEPLYCLCAEVQDVWLYYNWGSAKDDQSFDTILQDADQGYQHPPSNRIHRSNHQNGSEIKKQIQNTYKHKRILYNNIKNYDVCESLNLPCATIWCMFCGCSLFSRDKK